MNFFWPGFFKIFWPTVCFLGDLIILPFYSNNVMQRPSVSSMMRSMQPPQQQPPMASAVTMASPSTNCDISNTTDNAMLQKHSMMPNHQPAPMQPMSQSASQRLMATQQPLQPQQPRGRSPNLGQPNLGYPQSSQVRILSSRIRHLTMQSAVNFHSILHLQEMRNKKKILYLHKR